MLINQPIMRRNMQVTRYGARLCSCQALWMVWVTCWQAKSERSSSLFHSGRLQRLSILDHSFTAQKMAITAPVQTEWMTADSKHQGLFCSRASYDRRMGSCSSRRLSSGCAFFLFFTSSSAALKRLPWLSSASVDKYGFST